MEQVAAIAALEAEKAQLQQGYSEALTMVDRLSAWVEQRHAQDKGDHLSVEQTIFFHSLSLFSIQGTIKISYCCMMLITRSIYLEQAARIKQMKGKAAEEGMEGGTVSAPIIKTLCSPFTLIALC